MCNKAMAKASHFNIELVNQRSELGRVADIAKEQMQKQGFSKKQENDLFLILDEVLTNIIEYAYSDDKQHQINLSLALSTDSFEVIIIDDGRYFDMTEKKEVDTSINIEERELGGLGIYFVQQLADRMTYCRAGEKNVLKLYKSYSETGCSSSD